MAAFTAAATKVCSCPPTTQQEQQRRQSNLPRPAVSASNRSYRHQLRILAELLLLPGSRKCSTAASPTANDNLLADLLQLPTTAAAAIRPLRAWEQLLTTSYLLPSQLLLAAGAGRYANMASRQGAAVDYYLSLPASTDEHATAVSTWEQPLSS